MMHRPHTDIRAAWTARTEPESLPVLALWYWRAVLVTLVCGIAAVAWSGLSLFSDVRMSLEQQEQTPSHRAPVIDRQRLTALDAVFDARQRTFDARILSAPIPPDPSL